MAWPGHIKTGETISASAYIADIISIARTRAADTGLGELMQAQYELILAHAQLDSVNQGHGKVRTRVQISGEGVGGTPAIRLANLNSAWDEVKACYDIVALVNPPLNDLLTALNGIDHGGGG